MIKTKIEYADTTWNPVSGCLHDCSYCYARAIANRFGGCDEAPDGKSNKDIVVLKDRLTVTRKSGKVLNAAYPYGFTPTLHEYRLNDPKTKGFGKTVFVCSTADLFGWWVPNEWIQKVFSACNDAPGHRYLFLTKNPERYYTFYAPVRDDFWYGVTATNSLQMETAVKSVGKLHANANTFLSIEPLMEDIGQSGAWSTAIFGNCGNGNPYFKWVIIGAMTGPSSKNHQPKREWVEKIVNDATKAGIPVFMKDSMKPIWGEDIITQFPWGDDK